MKIKALRFNGVEMCIEPLAYGKAYVGIYKIKIVEGEEIPVLVGEKLQFDSVEDAERLLQTSMQACENLRIEYEVIGFDC